MNFLIVLLLTYSNGACAISKISNQSKRLNLGDIESYIHGGRNALLEEAPWQATIRDTINEFMCGATIIHHEFVATSAICLNSYTTKPGFVRYDTTKFNEYAKTVEVLQTINHESFVPGKKDYDIALLKTTKMDLTHHSGYINLPEQGKGLKQNEIINVSGFGYIWNDPPYSPDLQIVSLAVITRENCLSANPGLTERMFCAGDLLEFGDFCKGDNGGPGAHNGILYGIASWHKDMEKCDQSMDPGVYTDVSQLSNWIKGKLPHE